MWAWALGKSVSGVGLDWNDFQVSEALAWLLVQNSENDCRCLCFFSKYFGADC